MAEAVKENTADLGFPPQESKNRALHILALIALALSLVGLLLALWLFISLMAEFSPGWLYEAACAINRALPLSLTWMIFGTCSVGLAVGCGLLRGNPHGTPLRNVRLAVCLGAAGLLIGAQVLVTTPFVMFSGIRSRAVIIAGEMGLLILILGAPLLHAKLRKRRSGTLGRALRDEAARDTQAMTSGKTSRPGAVTIIVVGVLVLGGIAAVVAPVRMALSAISPSLPSEEELIDHFHERRSQLNSIVRMLGEDRQVTRFSSCDGLFYDEQSETPLSERRVDRYESLIREVALSTETWIERSHKRVRFTMAAYGIVPSGSEVGYEYSRKPLRSIPWTDTQDETIYKHLEGNWYIYQYSW